MTRILEKIAGIHTIQPNFENHRVDVTFDRGLTDQDAMFQTLEAGGYPAAIITEEEV